MTDPVPHRRVRPRYHFTAREGWLNDPLGVTFRPGGVELFFQYVPGGTSWAPACRWGHAVSADLLTWQETEPALVPGDGEDGCWSGCVVADPATLFYTAVDVSNLELGRVRSAAPSDESWRRWVKGAVVVTPPYGVEVTTFRDPFVLRDDDGWRMLVGAALAGGFAAVLTFTSPDLEDWTYDGVFATRHTGEREGAWTGSMWECPQLVRVDDGEFLVVSVWEDGVLQHVAYARGETVGGRFRAQRWQRLSFGPCHYAATSFRDDDGQPGLLHWLREVADPVSGWAGALSVPHRLSVLDGRLVAAPHPAVAAARRPLLGETTVGDGYQQALPSWHGEIVVAVEAHCRLEIRCAGDADRQPAVTLETEGRGAWTVASATGHSAHVEGAGATATVLVDGCVVEAFFGAAGVAAVPVDATAGSTPVLTVRADVAARLTVWDLAASEQT
jgi:beta-fructofuranosidase